MRVLFLLLFVPVWLRAEWVPPEQPKPQQMQQILMEAKADSEARRYAVALEKFVWFHNHALKYEPAQYGVRLSFALKYWKALADAHPPALEKMKEARQQARDGFLTYVLPECRTHFHTLIALKENLGESLEEVVALFEAAHKGKPEVATAVYSIAEPLLLKAGKFELCGKFVEPKSGFENALERFRHLEAMSKKEGRPTEMLMRYAGKSFTNEVTTLMVILVLNKRTEEAQIVADKARTEWNDPDFHASVERALKGELPKPEGP